MMNSQHHPMQFNQLFQAQLDEFRNADPLQDLDRIQSLYQQAHQANFVWVFILPGPAWVATRSYQLLRTSKLKHIRQGVVLVYPLIVTATVLYLLMGWHLLPTFRGAWQVFTNPGTIGSVLASLWNEHTFRTLWLIVANVVVAKWALSSCHLTVTFQTQYESLKQSCTKKWQETKVKIAVEQELIAQQPALIQGLINQATTLILANTELTELEQQKLVALLPQILQNSNFFKPQSKIEAPSVQKELLSYGENPFL